MRGLALGCDGSSTRGRMDTLPHRAAAAVAPIRDRRARRSGNRRVDLRGRGTGKGTGGRYARSFFVGRNGVLRVWPTWVGLLSVGWHYAYAILPPAKAGEAQEWS